MGTSSRVLKIMGNIISHIENARFLTLPHVLRGLGREEALLLGPLGLESVISHAKKGRTEWKIRQDN